MGTGRQAPRDGALHFGYGSAQREQKTGYPQQLQRSRSEKGNHGCFSVILLSASRSLHGEGRNDGESGSDRRRPGQSPGSSGGGEAGGPCIESGGGIALAKATYAGLKKAKPQKYYNFFPDFVDKGREIF